MVSPTEPETAAGAQQDVVIGIARDANGGWTLQPDAVHLQDVGRVVWRSIASDGGAAAAFRVVFQSGPAQPFAEAAGAPLPLSSLSGDEADADGNGGPAAWRLVLRSGAGHAVAAKIAPGLADGLYVYTVIVGADADFPEGQVQGVLDKTPLAGTPIIVVSSDPPLM
jgi:hypothetical protein